MSKRQRIPTEISEGSRQLYDRRREHIFAAHTRRLVFILYKGKDLNVFNKKEVSIIYDKDNQIKYAQPHLKNSHKHYGIRESIFRVIYASNLSREDKLRFERYMFRYA